jgi:nucleotide-binding universal stress UspA family protein
MPYAMTPSQGLTSGPEVSLSGSCEPETSHVLAEGIRLARTLMDEDHISGVSLVGHPAGVLAEASGDAEMVVVGQRSQDGPVSSAIGSTSLVLAENARCPVVVARGATGSERVALPVVVGVSGRASPWNALDFAAYTAQSRGVPLIILAAWCLPPAGEWRRARRGFDTVAQWSRALSAGAAAAVDDSHSYIRRQHPTVATRTHVDQLEPAAALERASRHAGLLVVGAGARGGPAREELVLAQQAGRVAQLVLGSAGCPVVVVPRDGLGS